MTLNYHDLQEEINRTLAAISGGEITLPLALDLAFRRIIRNSGGTLVNSFGEPVIQPAG